MELFLVGIKFFHKGFCLWRRSKLGESAKDLTTGDGTDINVVADNCGISSRDREGHLGEGRVERFNTDDLISFVVQSESA